uniref:Mitochondrial ribosomal protein L49 n=1 Tax=Sus scrofa TaxID=9823 RepID=A0A8W4FBR5_PIG
MAATVLCGVLRAWRTGVPLGCGLRRLTLRPACPTSCGARGCTTSPSTGTSHTATVR